MAWHKQILELLTKAATITGAVQIQGELAKVRYQVESLEGQLRVIENRVELATVNILVSAPVQHGVPEAEGVTSRVGRAGQDAAENGVGLLLGLIRAVPILLLLLVGGLAARWWWKRARR